MPYGLLAAVLAAVLTVRFLADRGPSPLAKLGAVLLLTATFVLPGLAPRFGLLALLLQVGLAAALLLRAYARGRSAL